MKKIIIFILLFINTLFANFNIVTKEDINTLKDLGLPQGFLYETRYMNTYKKLTKQKNIKYYDNIFKKESLITKIVQTKLEDEDLPSFLFFIPLIETGYNNIVSKNGSSGLWQIMPVTANGLKLRRDFYIDERLDLIKSTDAAVSYLKKFYKKLDKWYLAVIVYNAGEGRLMSGIARATLDKYLEKNPNMQHDKVIKVYRFYIEDYLRDKKGIDNLYTIYKDLGINGGYFDYLYLLKHNNKRDYLPNTSINYINKLTSFSIMANKSAFKHIDKQAKYELVKVEAKKGLKLKTVSDSISLNYSEFRSFNKHFLQAIIPNDTKEYNLYIPDTKLELFNSKLANMQEPNLNNNLEFKQKIIYTVVQGDTLNAIAKKYQISVKKLKIDNNKINDHLKIGEKIEIYK